MLFLLAEEGKLSVFNFKKLKTLNFKNTKSVARCEIFGNLLFEASDCFIQISIVDLV